MTKATMPRWSQKKSATLELWSSCRNRQVEDQQTGRKEAGGVESAKANQFNSHTSK